MLLGALGTVVAASWVLSAVQVDRMAILSGNCSLPAGRMHTLLGALIAPECSRLTAKPGTAP